MNARSERRGQPLIVLAAILVCWVSVRAAIWQAPFALPERAVNERWAFRDGERTFVPLLAPLPRNQLATGAAAAEEVARAGKAIVGALGKLGLGGESHAAEPVDAAPGLADSAPIQPDLAEAMLPPDEPGRSRLIPPREAVAVGEAAVAPAPAPARPASPRIMAGHQMLFLAAVAGLPLPEVVVKASEVAAAPAPAAALVPAAPAALTAAPASGRSLAPVAAEAPKAPRWSADGWLMLRRGGGAPAAGPAPATYGASQVGAVLRYRLDPASENRPAAYVRATAALNGSGERELAAGLSARPLAALPVAVMAELRASRLASGVTRARPAVIAVTELPPIAFPGGIRAEAYAQAGYVGGAAHTAFADGQIRADASVARLDSGELRAGAGVWGGAQQGASRLDIGPQASVAISHGTASARLSFDWRIRVAGNAAPQSGPALTLSAGF